MLDIKYAARRLWASKLTFSGALIVAVFILAAIFAPLISKYDPIQTSVADKIQAPSLDHPFGTDDLGRDILARVLYGARVSITVGFLAVAFGCLFGVPWGLVSGFYRGKTDALLMRIADALFAFPDVLLALAIMAVFGRSVANVILAIGIVEVPVLARVTRGSVLSERERLYILAERSLGLTGREILLDHILPNVLAPILVQATATLAYAILVEAALSFLGLGVPPPEPSWGRMLYDARGWMVLGPWMAMFPGLAISIMVLGVNLLGDGLREMTDPRMRGVSR